MLVMAILLLLATAMPLDRPSAKPRVRAPEAKAGAALLRVAAKRLPAQRRARCRRRGTGTRAHRFRCRWKAARQLSPNRARVCRGRGKVLRRSGRRYRAVVTRRRCGLRVKALAPRLGFHDNSVAGGRASPEQIARLVEATGAGLYRTLIDWRSAEPARDRYDWTLPDAIYAAMLKRGVRPLFLIAWAPPWARDPLIPCENQHCHFPPAPAHDREWREFAALMAQRYPRSAGIEIWNEPNESTGWNWEADPERFADLLRQAYEAIKKVNPSMPVISGGLSNRYESGDGSLAVSDFAERLFRAGGIAHLDGVGVHPYAPPNGLDRLNRPLDVVRSMMPQQRPIWVTEVGTSTTGGPLGASEQEQARAAVTAYDTFRRDPNVRAILIHTLIEPQPQHTSPENVGYGVVRGDLSPKPAHCALAKATGARSRCP